MNFSSYGAIFVLTLVLQDRLGHSAWTSGLVFVPMTLLIIPANLLAGPLTNRYGVVRVLVAGQTLVLLGLVGLCTTPDAVGALIAWLLPIGIGAGLAAPAMTTMMLTAVPGPRLRGGVRQRLAVHSLTVPERCTQVPAQSTKLETCQYLP